ncbi:hypothetical protein E4T44_01770 [Aureobasidium sp. EXF-8845]|nr:hypothetical protein E4T44_01770 [Aureobasidium sp. EXF-8845]KAI4856602.1 hypothetical protein E4T45_01930 [Aureobasidium sp. EXF-8846]
MTYLESRKQRMDVARIMKMNKSLASFMDSHQDDRKPIPPDRSSKSVQTPPITSKQSGRRDSTDKSSEDELPPGNSGRDYNQVFSRASALLMQSLSLSEDGGGVIILDTAPKSSGRGSTGHNFYRGENGPKRDPSRLSADTGQLSRTPSDEEGSRKDNVVTHAAILACSVSVASFGNPDQACHLDGEQPTKIPVKTLLKFIKKVPGGQIYHFPELRYPRTGALVRAKSGNPQHHGNVEEADVRLLFSHLPGAVEIILVPLWNTHLGRWSVCLAYTLSSERNFTLEIDYFFCRAFCNCVKAEVDRCAVVLADQQKGDFIGSVSHELRSPLHGILASCELIQETEMSRFQASLIDTTESCAHTLLDTIQMVLDYSKVNAFTKNPPGERLNVRPHVVKGGVEPLLSTYTHVNLAAIAEEVIEGVTTGYLAKSDPSMELGFSGDRAKRDAKTFEDLVAMPQSPVEVILDVCPPQDWTFVTQPGAYRRIIMNIFGNSLKYTVKQHRCLRSNVEYVLTTIQEHGYIKISLNCEEMSTKESDPSMAMVELTVEDSGKGISQAYMDTKMFTSFAQECNLSPGPYFLQRDFSFLLIIVGTGLGLSLVRSLVQMMDGEIEVQSEVNHGTKVRVRIPMRRANSQDPRDGFHRPNEDDIQTLRTILPRPQIVNFQQDILPEDTPQKREGYQMQKHALAACINGWYKVEELHHWDIGMETKPDIILVDDVHLLALTKHLKILEEIDAVVVILCSDRSRTTVISKNVDYPKLHIMPKPFGPFKFAKALKHALERRGPAPGTPLGPTISEDIGPTPELKQLTPTLRRNLSHSDNLSKLTKKPSFSGSFPFPSMTVTPAPKSPAPPIPGTTPQIEVPGTYSRRLKTLDVPLSSQEPLEKHNKLIRSHSEGGQIGSDHFKSVKPRILLVDDNEVNLKLLQTFFVRRGFTDMRLARDGSEAVKVYEDALLEQTPFQLVFMDISMPVMDGFKATNLIRQKEVSMAQSNEPHHSLVVALTGNASAEDQTDAFTNGMDMYMTKPVSLKEVGELMKAWEEKSGIYGAKGARSALLECNAAAE